MLTPTDEHTHASPVVVDHLYKAMMNALEKNSPDNVSGADILSAILSLLDNMLRIAKQTEKPENAEYNAGEISRVLTDMLFEFGTAGKVN